ncbi:hypothetical protein LLG95_04335 [bacterium]|nr:hypothetical protein [bacterium]
MGSIRRKILFGVLCVALAVMLVLTVFYSYIIYTPTGLEKVAKPMVAARARVVANAASIGRGAASGEKPGAAEKPNGKWVLDLGASINYFAGFNWGSPSHYFYNQYSVNRELQPETYPCERVPAAGGSLWAALDEKSKSQLTHSAHYFMYRRQTRAKLALADAAVIADELDKLDLFLLTSSRAMPRADQVEYLNISPALYIKTMMTIERACVRGQQQKALALLDGFLDTLRFLQYGYVHDGNITVPAASPHEKVFWRGLGLIRGLPPEWRDHARAALGKMAAMNAQPADSWPYTASMWRERITAKLDNSHYANQNFWHFFDTGERIVNRALRPVANRQVDSMCAALGRGDTAQFYREFRSLTGTLGLMNISWTRFEWRQFENFNNRAAQTAANARACLDLINQSDDRRTTETIAVERFGRFEDTNYIEIGPALNRERKLGRNVSTPAEIDEFIKKNKREDWRRYVKWYGPTTMKIDWVARGKEVVVTFPPEDVEFEEELRRVLTGKR